MEVVVFERVVVECEVVLEVECEVSVVGLVDIVEDGFIEVEVEIKAELTEYGPSVVEVKGTGS